MDADSQGPLAAEDALCLGTAQLSASAYEDAVDTLAQALQTKLDEIGGDELHPSLRRFYLAYGDALLQQEENLGDYLHLNRDSAQPSISEPSAPSVPPPVDGVEGENEATVPAAPELPPIPDEQLAWEHLELARLTYGKFFEEKGKEGVKHGDPSLMSDVEDASFVHVRLGDMLTVSEEFDEAAKEFQACLDLRELHHMPYTAMTAPLISLGQARLFGLRPSEAVECFKKALSNVEAQLNGVGGASISEDKLESFKLTAEDLTIQIAEVETNIEKGVYSKMAEEAARIVAGAAEASGGSSGSAAPPSSNAPPQTAKLNVLKAFDAEPARTTGNFDAPKLEIGDGVVDLGVFSSRKRKLESEGELNTGGSAKSPARASLAEPTDSANREEE